MPDLDDGDVIRDALALVETVHRRDFEAAGAITRNGDLRLVAMFLARIVGDLIGDLAEVQDASDTELLGRLRAGWTG